MSTSTSIFRALSFAPNPDGVKTRGPPYFQSFMAMAKGAAAAAEHSLHSAHPRSHDLATRPLVISRSKLEFTPQPFAGLAQIELGAGSALANLLAQQPQPGLNALAQPEPFIFQDGAGVDDLLAGDGDRFSEVTAESEGAAAQLF